MWNVWEDFVRGEVGKALACASPLAPGGEETVDFRSHPLTATRPEVSTSSRMSLPALDVNPAVGRHRSDRRATVTQRHGQALLDPALNHDREVDLQPAIGGAGFQSG